MDNLGYGEVGVYGGGTPQSVEHSWNAGPAIKVVTDFEQSLNKYPAISPGAPDPYRPPK
jgi:hypothetical protein